MDVVPRYCVVLWTDVDFLFISIYLSVGDEITDSTKILCHLFVVYYIITDNCCCCSVYLHYIISMKNCK